MNETKPSLDFQHLETALDIILNSESLEDLCMRAVTNDLTKDSFHGAHILLNTQGHLSLDSGYGKELPATHLEIAKSAIASQKIEFRAQATNTPALIAVPFIRNNSAEAIGILVLAPDANQNYLAGQLESILTKLTGFYLETQYGLGH